MSKRSKRLRRPNLGEQLHVRIRPDVSERVRGMADKANMSLSLAMETILDHATRPGSMAAMSTAKLLDNVSCPDQPATQESINATRAVAT